MTGHPVPAKSSFSLAQPVWPVALPGEMNTWVSFHARVGPPPRGQVVLHLVAATMCGRWINGALVGHGPARAGHGMARVDTYPLSTPAAGGWGTVIEVSEYGVPTFDATHEPAFCRAEVVVGRRVLVHTATRDGRLPRRATPRARARRRTLQLGAVLVKPNVLARRDSPGGNLVTCRRHRSR